MEPLKEFTNVIFDEIRIGATAELTVTMKQNQIDLAAMVSGDVDAFYLMQPGDADKRQEAKRRRRPEPRPSYPSFSAHACPDRGRRSCTGICVLPEEFLPGGYAYGEGYSKGKAQGRQPRRL